MKYLLWVLVAPLVLIVMLPSYIEWLHCKLTGRKFVWLDENAPLSF